MNKETPGEHALPLTRSGKLGDSHAIDKYVAQALEEHKREGLLLAVKARWIGLGIISVLLIYLNASWTVIYYHAILAGFALIGYAQLKIGRVGVSRAELFLMFCDLALLTFTLIVLNPLVDQPWSSALQYRNGGFIYFFFLLAAGTLSYSWRTIVAMGTWTTGLWLSSLVVAILLSDGLPQLSGSVKSAMADYPHIFAFLDPDSWRVETRIQEVVIFLIVATTLALSTRRSGQLLARHAAVVRERTNLARYFSPNVVEELSHNDDPLKQIRTQNVAVLFVDIVGFTAMTNSRTPAQIIETLRAFHGCMEAEVFRHNGTLDKYLGDGLMATFGTPFIGENDAGNALKCARAMIKAMDSWNVERENNGDPQIQVGLGIHYGSVVLGDIGTHRLEFSVIGNTVNIASRLEALTRKFKVPLIASANLIDQTQIEPNHQQEHLLGLSKKTDQMIRGIENPVDIWILNTN